MPLEYVTKSYVWIPRIGDLSGYRPGVIDDTGYLPLPAGFGFNFFTDAPELAHPVAAGSTKFQLPLPSWFPRKAFITRLRCVYNSTGQYGGDNRSDIIVWLDPKGISYNTGIPLGDEFGQDVTRQVQMIIASGYTREMHQVETMPYPVLFDRDAGDKIGVAVGSSVPLSNIGVCFEFIVPAPSQPQPIQE